MAAYSLTLLLASSSPCMKPTAMLGEAQCRGTYEKKHLKNTNHVNWNVLDSCVCNYKPKKKLQTANTSFTADIRKKFDGSFQIFFLQKYMGNYITGTF